MARWFILMLSLLQASSILSPAQTIAPDTPEPGSVEAIAVATGDKRFLSSIADARVGKNHRRAGRIC